MPPPNWMGRVNRGADGLIASAVGAVTGKGAVQNRRNAAIENPGAAKLLAWAAGSVLNTVASSITPFFRRTQSPSFKSIAEK
jgi:hypothetical protein